MDLGFDAYNIVCYLLYIRDVLMGKNLAGNLS